MDSHTHALKNISNLPTSKIKIGMNLDASENIYEGAGEYIKFNSHSVNRNITFDDVIIPEDSNRMKLSIGDRIELTPSKSGKTYSFVYGGVSMSSDVSSQILGAYLPNQTFVAAEDGDKFDISNPTSGTVKFTYKNSCVRTLYGEFKNLNDLAEAINNENGISARINENFLYVAPTDGREILFFSDITGYFVNALTLVDIMPAPNRFSTLKGLSELINRETNGEIKAVVENQLNGSGVKFFLKDPLDSITTKLVSLNGQLIDDFYLENEFEPMLIGFEHEATYDSKDGNRNMAGGEVTPHFSQSLKIYDSLDVAHHIKVAFLKIGNLVWAAEIYAEDYGQIAAGKIEFNGDGTLRKVDETLKNLEISWSNEAKDSEISINWGTEGEISGTVGAESIGRVDGLSMIDVDYRVLYIDTNEVHFGVPKNFRIMEDGQVYVDYDNGQKMKLFDLPKFCSDEHPEVIQPMETHKLYIDHGDEIHVVSVDVWTEI